MDFEVRQSGAIGDGRSMDTASLQAAIDRCSAAGGRRLVLPKGDYLTGTLYLRSGVELHLEQGATLLGSTDK